jgi:hypothetical protein
MTKGRGVCVVSLLCLPSVTARSCMPCSGGGPAPIEEKGDQVYALSGNLGSDGRSTGVMIEALLGIKWSMY